MAVWIFDVDGTLIGSVRSEITRPGALELLKALKDRAETCLCWSAGGDTYAREMMQQHGLAEFFDGFYSKLNRNSQNHYSVDHIPDRHRPDIFVDDSPVDLLPDREIVSVSQFMGNNVADRSLFDIRDSLDLPRRLVRQRLETLFHRYPEEQSIQFEDSWVKWGEIGKFAESLSEVLISHGIPEGVGLSMLMRQRPAMLVSQLAVLALGRTAILVSPLQSDSELISEVSDSYTAVLMVHHKDWGRPGLKDVALKACCVVIIVDDIFQMNVIRGSANIPHVKQVDTAVTVLTSGTTGRPKRLPVNWKSFVEVGGGASENILRPVVSGRGALILSLPLVTLGGLLSISRLIFGGRPLSMMERFDVHVWASLVQQHRPKVIGAPPAVLQMILDAGFEADYFSGVTAFVTSSAPLRPEIAQAFEEKYHIPVLLSYGATEFLNSVTGWSHDLWREFGARKLGSVGRASADVKLRIIDVSDGSEVAIGNEGILEVDPPQRAGGLAPGWLRTNDLARIDADGFLWILGRTDDVIIRGGFKVDLRQVEDVLWQHGKVIDCCVLGVDDPRLGEVPRAVVVGPGVGIEELNAWMKERVAVYAVPERIVLVDSIPVTANFKVDRVAVRVILQR